MRKWRIHSTIISNAHSIKHRIEHSIKHSIKHSIEHGIKHSVKYGGEPRKQNSYFLLMFYVSILVFFSTRLFHQGTIDTPFDLSWFLNVFKRKKVDVSETEKKSKTMSVLWANFFLFMIFPNSEQILFFTFEKIPKIKKSVYFGEKKVAFWRIFLPFSGKWRLFTQKHFLKKVF